MNPRFIVRLEDGTDLPLEDVEALAREVELGRVRESNLLFDSSTGRWEAAGSVPLFQFLKEELERRREERSAEDEPGSGEEGSGREVDFDLGAFDPPAQAPVDDPLAMELSLTPPPVAPWSDPAPDETAEPPPEPSGTDLPPEDVSAPEMTSLGDLETESERDAEPMDEQDAPAPSPPGRDRAPDPPGWDPAPDPPGWDPAPDPPGRDPAPDPSGRDPDPASAGWTPEPDPPPRGRTSDPHRYGEPLRRRPVRDEGGPDRARAPAEPAPRRRGRWLPLLLATGVTGAVILAFFVPSTADPSDQETGARQAEGVPRGQPPGTAQVPGASLPSLPDPLLERAWSVRSRVREGLSTTVEDLRLERGLADGPPGAWLSGRYFSGASTFPEVREYWGRYGELVDDLRDRGRTLFVESVEEETDGEGDLTDEERERIRVYLVSEFDVGIGARERRYEVLDAVARTSVELHDLLEAHEEEIIHVPAIGSAISPEPVLEARIPNPLLQREVEALLDRILGPLTRASDDEPVTRAHVLQALFGDLVPR